jgi:SPOR domain
LKKTTALHIILTKYDVFKTLKNTQQTNKKDAFHILNHFFIRKFPIEMKQIMLLVLFISSFFQTATAQLTATKEAPTNVYTVQLGTFDPSVKQSDFEVIRALAYVYQRDGVVFAGSFGDEAAAEAVLEKIKAKGFPDASIASRSLKKAKTVYVIQIATKNAGEPMNWKAYSAVGNLFTIPNLAQVRIVHGVYEDKSEANLKLKEIQDLGFADAFVKGVKDVQINPLSAFDTGDKKLVIQSPAPTATAPVIAGSKNPLIDYSKIKRKSVVKLQEALTEIGASTSTADGLFGKATQTSFERSIQSNRRLQTFNELSQKHEGFEGWADVRLLMTIARELSVKDNATAIVPDLLNNLPDAPLSAADANASLNWHIAHWKRMDAWSSTGQYNDQLATAYKVAYYRTIVHLEDYFGAKNIRGEAGTALAVSVVKTLIGQDFDGF